MAPKDDKAATLKTVAELTGLSMSTVSLAMRDGSHVKRSTRDTVMKAAKQVGYVPNRAGIRLRTGRTNALALVLSSNKNIIEYARLLIQGIGQQVFETNYQLSVIPEFEHADPLDAVRQVLNSRSVDGVILTHTRARDPRVQLLLDAGFPFVTHGRTEFLSPHAFYDFDVERFVELAVERLLGKGRRRLLLATIDNQTTITGTAIAAFNRAIGKAGVTGDVAVLSDALGSASVSGAIGHTLAKKRDQFDAVICLNELTAMAVVSGLRDCAIMLGRDYDLICKQMTELLPILYPRIDTIFEDVIEAGQELTRLLIQCIDGQDPQDLQKLYTPQPRWRSSP